VRTNGTEHLKDKVAYLEELGEHIHKLHDQGLSARRIRRRVLGRELPITYLTLGHFSGLRLVQSYLAEPPLPERAEKPIDEAHVRESDEPSTPEQASS
jgi:hypothetical protein